MRGIDQSGRVRRRHRRGTAMVEFCFALPIFATIFVLVMFMGRAAMHTQRVHASGRYVGWRRVQRGGDGDYALDRRFFMERAVEVDLALSSGPDQNLRDYVLEVGDWTGPGYDLAEESLLDNWPRGVEVSVRTDFVAPTESWRRFEGSIRGHHVRDGVPWRFGEASPRQAVLKLWMDDLDQGLSHMPSPGDELAERFRHLIRGGGW